MLNPPPPVKFCQLSEFELLLLTPFFLEVLTGFIMALAMSAQQNKTIKNLRQKKAALTPDNYRAQVRLSTLLMK